jgi:hypothetical protein
MSTRYGRHPRGLSRVRMGRLAAELA